jgi:hypothetical protein
MASTWDRIRAALKREKRDIDEAVEEWTTQGNAVLDRKERELTATPEERLAMEQQKSDEIDAELEAVRRRIEGDR